MDNFRRIASSTKQITSNRSHALIRAVNSIENRGLAQDRFFDQTPDFEQQRQLPFLAHHLARLPRNRGTSYIVRDIRAGRDVWRDIILAAVGALIAQCIWRERGIPERLDTSARSALMTCVITPSTPCCSQSCLWS
jgi:hypothetical protein